MKLGPVSNKTFHLKLTTLSPLAINSGIELSPLADYFVLDGKLHYVDGDKFQRLLLGNEDLQTSYEVKIKNTKIDGADNFLNELIGDKELLHSIAKDETVPYRGKKTVLLKEVISSNGHPYIPGSSIKGAVKNAVLYYWLTAISPTCIDLFIRANQVHFEDFIALKERLKELKAIPHKNRSEEDWKEIKGIEGKERDILKSLDRFSSDAQKKAFDIVDDMLRQPASNLKISDSETVSFTRNIEVAGMQRRSLKSSVNDWVLHIQEYVKPQVEFETTLQISEVSQDWKEFSTKQGLAKVLYNSKSTLKLLFEILNHFADAVNDVQREFKLDNPLSDYKPGANEGLLFLGSGKGIYKNTVLLAIRKYYEKEAKDFKTEFAPLIATIKTEFEDFPNSVSHIDNQPLGWIKITDVNKEYYFEKTFKSYTEDELHSGKPIEAIFKLHGKPRSKVSIMVNGKEQLFEISGTKEFYEITILCR